jgi:hypothetical protein
MATDLAGMSDAELLAATGGCTELSCIYNTEFVAEIRRRRSPATPSTTDTTTTEGGGSDG